MSNFEDLLRPYVLNVCSDVLQFQCIVWKVLIVCSFEFVGESQQSFPWNAHGCVFLSTVF